MMSIRTRNFDNSLETLSAGLAVSAVAQNQINEARMRESCISSLLVQLSASTEDVIVVDFQAGRVLEKSALTDQPVVPRSTNVNNPALRIHT